MALGDSKLALDNLEQIIKRYSNAAYKEVFPITGEQLNQVLAFLL